MSNRIKLKSQKTSHKLFRQAKNCCSRCLICEAKVVALTAYIPRHQRSLRVPKGKVRTFIYGLCDACIDNPLREKLVKRMFEPLDFPTRKYMTSADWISKDLTEGEISTLANEQKNFLESHLIDMRGE